MKTSARNPSFQSRAVRHYKTAVQSDFGGKVAETYLTRILVMGLALASTVIVSRFLGPLGRGYYAIAVATGALGVQFATLGMHASNGYFVAKYPESLPSLMGNALVVSLGFGTAVSAALAIVFRMRPHLLDIHGTLLWLALLWIPLGLAFILLQSLLLGVQDIRGYNWGEIGSKIISIVLIAGLIVSRQAGVTTLFAAALIGLVLTAVWEGARLKRRFPGWPRLSRAIFGQGINYALKAYLAATFSFLVLRADLFMVQHMLGPEQAGYYSIAAIMAENVSILATVVGTILFPKLSALVNLREKFDLTKRAAIGTTLILAPFLGIAALLAKPVVQILFGKAFLPASSSFILLLPGMLCLGINAVSVQFLNSIGYPRSVVYIWGLGSVLNILVNIWAIPRFGIMGASVVSSISYFLVAFFIMCVFYREGHILDRIAA